MRDLEAARYAVNRAFCQYEATDPANRLVAAEPRGVGSALGSGLTTAARGRGDAFRP